MSKDDGGHDSCEYGCQGRGVLLQYCVRKLVEEGREDALPGIVDDEHDHPEIEPVESAAEAGASGHIPEHQRQRVHHEAVKVQEKVLQVDAGVHVPFEGSLVEH
eukprot:TRINITY_DN95628_c0_g1_i1.p5 TRINITY_DN95628_c0_g1~~TRINITY_DN95628_c0_g1_i1.p5  ORF type:complete len:104 (+),score=17.80 TRINITY_DN95628_c0_g1_i1:338-649(+)